MPRSILISIVSGLFLWGALTSICLGQQVSFLDLCLNQNKLNADRQHTIRAMLAFAKASNCEQAAIRLESTESLSLPDQGIRDLIPIGTLKNLSQLNLMNNQIKDLRPLKGLEQLQTLNLTENRIENLEPISALITLKKLWLDSNEVFDIGPIEANINLVLLSFNDNRVKNIVGLKRLWKLKHISHWGNPIQPAHQSYSVLNP